MHSFIHIQFSPSGMIADELRASGVTLIVIGIGSGTKPAELARVAGGEDNALNAADFQELIDGPFLKTLSTKTCEVGEKTLHCFVVNLGSHWVCSRVYFPVNLSAVLSNR